MSPPTRRALWTLSVYTVNKRQVNTRVPAPVGPPGLVQRHERAIFLSSLPSASNSDPGLQCKDNAATVPFRQSTPAYTAVRAPQRPHGIRLYPGKFAIGTQYFGITVLFNQRPRNINNTGLDTHLPSSWLRRCKNRRKPAPVKIVLLANMQTLPIKRVALKPGQTHVCRGCPCIAYH